MHGKPFSKAYHPLWKSSARSAGVASIETFGTAMDVWLTNARLADSTRAKRKHITDRDILPVFRNLLLTEIQAEEITCRLKEALALIDVRVIDHIVVAGNTTVSLAERGLL